MKKVKRGNMLELMKAAGIPASNTTNESVGQSLIVPMGSKKPEQPPAPPKQKDKKLDNEGLEP